MSRRRERERTKIAKSAPQPLRQLVEDKAEPETLDEYAGEIRAQLKDITADAELVQRLLDSRQRRMVDLDATTREAMANEAAAARLAQESRRRADEELGHGWLRPDETSLLHGPTATPGDATAISVGEEIVRTLHRVAIDLTDFDFLPRLPETVGLEKIDRTASRIRVFLGAAGDVDLAAVQRSHRALAQLQERIGELVDGHNQTSRIPDPCPHCGRQTLVVFWDWQVIRCDRTTDSTHYQACTCTDDPLCECKRRPVSHRHTWYGPACQIGSLPTWKALSNRLNLGRAATTPAPKKKRKK